MANAEPRWIRLEPQPLDRSLAEGLRAEVHDPLWLLGRQLQFGELHGQDAGSPVYVTLEGETGRLTTYRLGDGPALPLDGGAPLEELVEAEDPRDARWAVTSGLRFLALMSVAGLAGHGPALRDRFPMPDPGDRDEATRALLTVTGVTAPDGIAVRAAIADGSLGVPELAAVSAAYAAWYDALAAVPQTTAWVAPRMEYQFSVAGRVGGAEVVLTATEYDNGELDWSSFDAGGSSLGAVADNAPVRRAGLPTPVVYRGMPSPRFWEFEDAAVDFGALTAAREELTKLLLIEFATVYGNDHFVVPVDVPVGSLCRITRLTVIDSFGIATEVPHISEADASRAGTFRLFEADGLRSPVFLLAPTLGSRMESAPIERVALRRDEGANMAWTVEAVAADRGGLPIDRADLWLPPPSGPPPTGAPAWGYRLRTAVPDHWIPLLPVADGSGSIHFELSPAPSPWGQILAELSGQAVPEEEINRAPSELVRSWQYARWTDGTQRSWIGRRRLSAETAGDSGLRFDLIEPA
ncbi:hypothetical protein PS9374_04566 [Planomonospora sphaerica]|uniref:Uncharacterized protein n=1 Tax=Planomonospora sphaerica TaxID=161355 RepID=A0A171DJ82_9ACTN|nr:hypothetical protein [Planomonospora sphaerica]GAT68901.1 hypothetical protein PS9374_04566 [Planomonospora sphaerica]